MIPSGLSTVDLTALENQWKYALHYNCIRINNLLVKVVYHKPFFKNFRVAKLSFGLYWLLFCFNLFSFITVSVYTLQKHVLIYLMHVEKSHINYLHICCLISHMQLAYFNILFPENKEMIYKYLVNILTGRLNVAISYNTHPRDQTSLKFEEEKNLTTYTF